MELNIGKGLEYSVLGIAIVFAVIIILMIVVKIMTTFVGGAVAAAGKKASVATAGNTRQAENALQGAPAVERTQVPAPGSAGEVKLYGVSDRDAAMIMAITADKMGAPLNELRFLSIREVKEDEV